MGFDPSADSAQRYYTVGFGAAGSQNNVLADAGLEACRNVAAGDNATWFKAEKNVNASKTACKVVGCLQPNTGATESLFTASAGGFIAQTAAGITDVWTINEKKLLKQNQVGY